MEIKANLNHLRMSPRKVRLVIDVVRNMPVMAALDQLKFINKKATEPIAKLLNSAIANAVNTYDLEKSNLYIKTIVSSEGVMLKRWFPRAHGRATSIRKRGCHLSIILDELVPSGKGTKKAVVLEKPVKLEKMAKDAEAQSIKKPAASTKDKTKDKTMDEGGKGGKGFAGKMFNRKVG